MTCVRLGTGVKISSRTEFRGHVSPRGFLPKKELAQARNPSSKFENKVPISEQVADSQNCRVVAQLGRAPRSGRGGRGFESRRPDQFDQGPILQIFVFANKRQPLPREEWDFKVEDVGSGSEKQGKRPPAPPCVYCHTLRRLACRAVRPRLWYGAALSWSASVESSGVTGSECDPDSKIAVCSALAGLHLIQRIDPYGSAPSWVPFAAHSEADGLLSCLGALIALGDPRQIGRPNVDLTALIDIERVKPVESATQADWGMVERGLFGNLDSRFERLIVKCPGFDLGTKSRAPASILPDSIFPVAGIKEVYRRSH